MGKEVRLVTLSPTVEGNIIEPLSLAKAFQGRFG